MRVKPTKEEMKEYLDDGMSLRMIHKKTGYSVSTLSALCTEYELEKPKIGRPRGYKVSTETRAKISEANRRDG